MTSIKTRIADCLHRWGIKDRLLSELPSGGIVDLFDKTIDYHPVTESLDADICSSRDYLYRAVFERPSGEELAVPQSGSYRHGHF